VERAICPHAVDRDPRSAGARDRHGDLNGWKRLKGGTESDLSRETGLERDRTARVGIGGADRRAQFTWATVVRQAGDHIGGGGRRSGGEKQSDDRQK